MLKLGMNGKSFGGKPEPYRGCRTSDDDDDDGDGDNDDDEEEDEEGEREEEDDRVSLFNISSSMT